MNQGRACVIVTPFTHEPTHKTMWDVHTNINIFPRLTMWDVHKNGNIFLGLTVCDKHTNGNVFLGFTVWDVHTYGNDLWDLPCGMYIPMETISEIHRVGCTYEQKQLGFDASPDRTRAHFTLACVPEGPIPDGF